MSWYLLLGQSEERYCEHCETDTPHKVIDSNHERDSSQDYRECLVCGWWYLGICGVYNPPIPSVDIPVITIEKKGDSNAS